MDDSLNLQSGKLEAHTLSQAASHRTVLLASGLLFSLTVPFPLIVPLPLTVDFPLVVVMVHFAPFCRHTRPFKLNL